VAGPDRIGWEEKMRKWFVIVTALLFGVAFLTPLVV
jgi:hypothetical protein